MPGSTDTNQQNRPHPEQLQPTEARNQPNSASYIVFEGSHFARLIQNSCNHPRPEINLTRQVGSFLRVPTTQSSSGRAATILRPETNLVGVAARLTLQHACPHVRGIASCLRACRAHSERKLRIN